MSTKATMESVEAAAPPRHAQVAHRHKRRPGRPGHAGRSGHARRRRPRFDFLRDMQLQGTKYDVITSVGYLSEKYGLRKTHYIENFLSCIHRKINHDVSRIPDAYVDALNPWAKAKLYLLLVTLSERGGPDYWLDKNNAEGWDGAPASAASAASAVPDQEDTGKVPEYSEKPDEVPAPPPVNDEDVVAPPPVQGDDSPAQPPAHSDDAPPLEYIGNTNTLMELVIQKNINEDFKETTYDEDYVFSSIWANFMEGLINHYLERIIVPHSEMKVCQQLYKPMMKIISLYNEYNELMEKSEKNGFLPPAPESAAASDDDKSSIANSERDDVITKERLARAQKLLWQARQDIPKTISKELTLLSEMYSTLIADEQDYELDEFVCCAEEYVEIEFLPVLIDVLFKNCGSKAFWKVLLVLEPFFYYIEDVGDLDDSSINLADEPEAAAPYQGDTPYSATFKPDPRVITLEKICEVAARQKWI